MTIPPEIEYVYAVRYQSDPEYIKIGRTTDPKSRIAQLQVGSRSAAEMVWCSECDNNVWFEYNLHQSFKPRLVRGEWYRGVTVGMLDRAKEMLDKEYQIMEFGENISNQILQERKKQKLSQIKLAQMAGVRQATISNIENVEAVHLPTLIKVVSALGKKLSMVDM